MSHGALPVNYMMLKYPSIEDMENFLALVYKLYGGEPEDDFYTFVNKKSLDDMAWNNRFPKVPRTCAYVTLYDKRDFADKIKLWVLRWGDYSG